MIAVRHRRLEVEQAIEFAPEIARVTLDRGVGELRALAANGTGLLQEALEGGREHGVTGIDGVLCIADGWMASTETSLVILVPEAEPLVGSFRQKHDPSAAAGMPAHITLLYPFKPPTELSADVLEGLDRCFAGFVPFSYSLAAVRRFSSEVLYLAPKPDGPFRDLTLAICERYPERTPYGGKYAGVIPHLTVAQVQNKDDFDRIAEDFARTRPAKAALRARAA